MDTYTFRPVTPPDLTLILGWLRQPHVRDWWGDPSDEIALIAEGLAMPSVTCLLVETLRPSSGLSEPFAYVQHWDAKLDIEFHDLPDGTRGIDPFIGVPDMVGCGHGARFLRQLACNLVDAGAPMVIIDPDPANRRAIRAYQKAGFHAKGLRPATGGDVLLMSYRPMMLDAPKLELQ
ncbi:MAG: acetyltransferase [Hyphomicrobiaceae bacterium]|nr:acetyltransferase [Hyphomicrobiaceae bacterium]